MMKAKHGGCVLAIALCAGVLISGCEQLTTPVPEPTAQPTEAPAEALARTNPPEAEWTLVVIGDSTLGGLARAFALQIEDDVGVRVVRYDNVVPELSAGHVLGALQMENPPAQSWEGRLAEILRQAEVLVVVMFVNPVDSVDPERPLDNTGCFYSEPPQSCSAEAYEQYTDDLKAIWAKVFELRAGQPAILRALDTFVPLVAPWKESGVFEACTVCWENESSAARLAAEAYDIPFLSRYDAFNGADHSEDPREKGYIVSDGVHPSDLAAEHTAEMLSRMGYEPVPPP
jgi:hypothetical protein